MKVVVAMSGGVDSAMAAYLLREEGHEVYGVSFQLWDKRDLPRSNVCCSIETIRLAESIARELGIRHSVIDVRDAFYSNVIEEFCDTYMSGRTPNPCILCNKYIKFNFLIEEAEKIGADKIATGHYAISTHDQRYGSRWVLKKGIDPVKDQSYVLYVMTQTQLSRTIFPIGKFRKDQIKRMASDIGLYPATRTESQEICFVGEGRYIDFIRKTVPQYMTPGPIMDEKGNILGEHKGISAYTIGQRKGLGVSKGKPLYVIDIDVKNNAIIIGPREKAYKKTFIVRDINWIAIETITHPLKASVKIRSTMKEEPATIYPLKGGLIKVEYEEPQWAPAPGQSAVFYEGDVVLGGGVIEEIID